MDKGLLLNISFQITRHYSHYSPVSPLPLVNFNTQCLPQLSVLRPPHLSSRDAEVPGAEDDAAAGVCGVLSIGEHPAFDPGGGVDDHG